MQITGITNGTVSLALNNATDMVYEVWIATSLTNPVSWTIEQEVWPVTNQTWTPFTVEMQDRTNNLFFGARDWTGITSDGNQTPQYWFWKYFGTVNLLDSDLDSIGNTLLSDYLDGNDPNVIYFSLSMTNRDLNTSSATVQISVANGVPSYMAALVDSSDYSNANWTRYNSNIVVNLGSVEGWHTVSVGLRGLPQNAQQTWEQTQLKLVLTPPALIVTNPAVGPVPQPLISIQGYSPSGLASVSYDLNNAYIALSNVSGYITGATYDPNNFEFTNDAFECFDIMLTEGTNIVTVHATDLAGNEGSTNLVYVFDPSPNTNPPALSIAWPPNNASISGSSFPVRGVVGGPFATVSAVVSNANITATLTAFVEADGAFWIEGVPLAAGTTVVNVTAVNGAGYSASASLAVTQSTISLSLYSVHLYDPSAPTARITGNFSGYSGPIWVNGVQASTNTFGQWLADNVPVGTGGTATVTVVAGPSSQQSDALSSDADPSTNAPSTQISWDQSKPPVIGPQEYRISCTETCPPCGGGTSSAVWDINWAYNQPGNVLRTFCSSGYYNPYNPCDNEYLYTAGAWDCNNTGVFTNITTCGTPCGTGPQSVSPDLGGGFPFVGEEASGQYTSCYGGCQTVDNLNLSSRWALYTEGKASPGQINLWTFHLATWPSRPEFEAMPENTGPSFTPDQVSVAGQHPDTNNTFYLALPDNSPPVDITPLSPLPCNFLPDDAPVRYQPQIVANDVVLDPQTVVSDATFCVGQQIAFSVKFSPSLSQLGITNILYQWTPPGNFVNSSTVNSAGCASYTDDPTLLVTTNSAITNWYVNGTGGTISVGISLVAPNGHIVSLAALGQFAIYQPAVGTAEPFADLPYGSTFTNNSPGCTVALTANEMNFKLIISSDFDGQAAYVQLINADRWSDLPNPEITGGYWLDNSYPYSDPVEVSAKALSGTLLYFDDQPSFAGMNFVSVNDNFKTYLIFQPKPTATSVWVALCEMDWFWTATGQLDPWEFTAPPPTLSGPLACPAMPEWSNIIHNGEIVS